MISGDSVEEHIGDGPERRGTSTGRDPSGERREIPGPYPSPDQHIFAPDDVARPTIHTHGGYCSLCDEMERALAALQAALEERTSERNVLRSLCGELWDERQELQADLLDGQVPLF